MPVTINGTTGIAGVDGSASTPAVQGSDTNTGEFFPAADTIAWTTGGSERMRVDSSGNVGIGTSSPGYKLDVQGSASGAFSINIQNTNTGSNAQARTLYTSSTNTFIVGSTNDSFYGAGGILYNGSAVPITFFTSATERMRIDSSGNLLVGTTGTVGGSTNQKIGISFAGNTTWGIAIKETDGANGSVFTQFINSSNSVIGNITRLSASTVSYNTSSDYRLKENVQPMTTGLVTIGALKPVTYDWISDKSAGEGFLAHELQSVIPLAVTGEKDAVDEEGNIKPQGVDYSKIVVHLVAAMQELKAELDALKGTK